MFEISKKLHTIIISLNLHICKKSHSLGSCAKRYSVQLFLRLLFLLYSLLDSVRSHMLLMVGSSDRYSIAYLPQTIGRHQEMVLWRMLIISEDSPHRVISKSNHDSHAAHHSVSEDSILMGAYSVHHKKSFRIGGIFSVGYLIGMQHWIVGASMVQSPPDVYRWTSSAHQI